MRNISKSFPGVSALNSVDFELCCGEIHALVGENGAGKSVLMKIMNGIYHPDAGEFFYKGSPAYFNGEEAAQRMGIAMIHQEPNPLRDMTVSDNIFLNHYPVRGFQVDRKKLYRDTEQLFETLGMTGIYPDTVMRSLTMAQVQMVEIAKALAYKTEVLVMDEPTSSVSDKEVETILGIMNNLRNEGIAIVFTSHKIDEVRGIADRITVLRDGRRVACRYAGHVQHSDLIIMMAGHKINEVSGRGELVRGEPRLEVSNLSSPDSFSNISFQLYGGEVLCLAGLIGAKKTEVAKALFGLHKISSGKISINGKAVKIRVPQDAIRHKIAFVPEDRKEQGLFLERALMFNISITNLKNLRKGCFVDRRKEKMLVGKSIDWLGVKAKSMEIPVKELSGGNQQKVVLAKWLEQEPDILILDDPTRGIDVGARQELYRIIGGLAKQGKAILLISSDIPEIIALSDRVVVMNEGRIKAVLEKDDISQENITRYAVKFD